MTTSIDQIKNQVEDLSKRFKTASSKKANLSGLLQAKKEELAALVKEIEDAGLDPKKLKERRDELQEEVVAMIEDLDKRLKQVEEAFTAFEKK